MKTIIKAIFITSIFLSNGFTIQAQSEPDEIIFKAMNDELSRNMTKLMLDNRKPPFFIAYQLYDTKMYTIKATLGSIMQSQENTNRSSYMRLMVGDYTLNDENFVGGRQSDYANTYLPIPLENNYNGIRQSFWSMSDKVYKSAIESYEQKVTAIKLMNKPEEERLDDYSRIIPVNYVIKGDNFDVDKAKWETFAKEVSGQFKSYPQITSSFTLIHFIHGWVYLTTSEGSNVRFPVNMAYIMVNAGTLASDGEQVYDRVQFIAPQPDQLPTSDKIGAEVKQMADGLMNVTKAPFIEDTYSGPVIFEGEALAELVSQNLFSSDKLIAQREPVYANEQEGSENNPDIKPEKKIMDVNITVTSTPKLKTFQNIPLIGGFDIDAEGVIPSDELVLIENGKLKTLLNDRIPTRYVKKSNGYSRISLYREGIASPQKAPSIINMTYKEGKSMKALMKATFKAAKKQDLEYIYQVSKGFGNKLLEIYKVSVKTGEKQLVRKALLRDFDLDKFKSVISASDNQFVYNTLFSSGRTFVPATFIVPQAMAFNNVNIDKDRGSKQKLPQVPNPLVSGE